LRHRAEHLRFAEARVDLLGLARRFERMADWLLGRSSAEDPGADAAAMPPADDPRR